MRLKFFSSNKTVIYLFLIIIVAALVRVVNLNSIPVFADEAIYIRWSQIMRAEETLRFLPLSDGKQPLFMWITIPFLKLISDPLVAGRLVSVFAGIGTLVGVFALTQILFKSDRLTLTASGIYALLPYSVFFDRLALVDSLLGFFGIWTIIFAILVIKNFRLDLAMFAGFSLGGALLTKSPGIYFAFLIPFTFFLTDWPKKNKEKFFLVVKYSRLLIFTYVIGFAMQNILRLGPNFHMIALRNADYVYPLSHVFTSPFDPLKPFLLRNLEHLWILGTPVFVVFVILGMYFGLKKYWKKTLVLCVLAFGPILVSSEFSKTMTARYIYPSVVFLIIIAAFSFLEVLKGKYKKLGVLVMALFILLSSISNFNLLFKPEKMWLPRSERSGYLEEWTAGQGIKKVSEHIRSEFLGNPTQKIVVGTEGYFGTLPDGLQIYLNNMPEITVIGVGQPIRSVSTSLIESKEAGNKTYLVVNSDRLLLDPSQNNLAEIVSFEKAQNPLGNTEKLILFELK